MNITVIYSPSARLVRQWPLVLPTGYSVKQALAKSLLFHEFPELLQTVLRVGIWGQRCNLSQLLKENDRIEIYRSLRVDPKTARRERFARQGAKRAGLFANKRIGAKAGYGG